MDCLDNGGPAVKRGLPVFIIKLFIVGIIHIEYKCCQ